MDQIKQSAGILSFLFGMAAAAPYILAILRGHRPPYATYVGWLLIGLTAIVFHYQTIDQEDEKWSVLIAVAFSLIPAIYITLLIFLGSPWILDTRDRIVLAALLICWTGWVLSSLFLAEQHYVPILLLILTEAFATWPILQDAMRGKESAGPNRISWGLTALSAWLSLLSVAEYVSAEILYPLYLTVVMSAMALFSFLNRNT